MKHTVSVSLNANVIINHAKYVISKEGKVKVEKMQNLDLTFQQTMEESIFKK
jgi:hypothetical protein